MIKTVHHQETFPDKLVWRECCSITIVRRVKNVPTYLDKGWTTVTVGLCVGCFWHHSIYMSICCVETHYPNPVEFHDFSSIYVMLHCWEHCSLRCIAWQPIRKILFVYVWGCLRHTTINNALLVRAQRWLFMISIWSYY